MTSLPRGSSKERWYEFTQVERIYRPFWIRASSLQDAREKLRQSYGNPPGVADWAPDGPGSVRIIGPGKLADQEAAQDMADERGYE